MDVNEFHGLVKKYADTTAYPRMYGTSQGLDYIIVAQRPEVNLQLGIKPLITIGKTKTSVGFRLRSAPIPSGKVVVPLLPDKKSEKVTQGYPSTGWAFPWEKISDERASLVRMYSFERDAKQINHLWEDLSTHRFFGKLSSFLLECAPAEQWHITPDELKEWMQQGFFPDVNNIAMQYDPQAKLATLKAQSEAQQQAAEAQIKELEEEVSKLTPEQKEAYQAGELFSEDFLDQSSTAALMLGKIKPALSVVADADKQSVIDAIEATGSDAEIEANIAALDSMSDDAILADSDDGDPDEGPDWDPDADTDDIDDD